MADGGVREGRRGERKMMVQSVMDRGRAEQRGRDEAELGRPAMADAAWERGEREMERAGSGEGDGEGVLVPLLIGSWAQGTAVEADHAARKLGHGGHVHGHASPFGQILEHVAGNERGMVGGAFGLDPGRIRTWAEYEDRSPHEALRFLLRVPSHLSCRSAVNQVQS